MISTLAGSPVTRAIGLALLQFLWQGAVLGLATALTLKMLRRATSNTRYLVACVALLAMLIAPLVSATRTVRERPAQLDGSTISASVERQPATIDDSLASHKATVTATGSWGLERVEEQLPIVVLVWSIGVLALTLHLMSGWIAVERIRRQAIQPVADAWRTRMLTIATHLHVTRRLRMAESSMVDVPTVIGWMRPLILVPASALAGLSPFELEAVIAHELAHIRRHDYLVNVLQSLVETLLFYHPAVWWISKRIRVEREHCCDDLAVELCGDRVAYARALASLEEMRAGAPALAMAATGGDLVARIRRLLGVPAREERQSSAWAVVGVVLIAASFGLAGTRVHGATAPPRSPESLIKVQSEPVVASVRIGVANQPQTRQAVAVTRSTDPETLAVQTSEEQYRLAKLQNDVVALGGLMDDAFVGTNQNGNTRNKGQALELWRDFPISSLVTNSLSVRIADGTAVVTGSQTEVNSTGTDVMLFSRVWKKDGGGTWRLISNAQFRDPRAPTRVVYSSPRTEASAIPGVSETVTVIPSRPGTSNQQSDLPPWPAAADAVRVGRDIKEPRKIRDVKPIYPQIAEAANIQGIVIIEAIIDRDGNVSDARVLRSQPLLEQAALDAVRQWRFTPTLLNGSPVPVIMTVTVNFSLH